MDQTFPWKRRTSVSPPTESRRISDYWCMASWRERIDESSGSFVCSVSVDSGVAGERAKTIHVGAGAKRALPSGFVRGEKRQSHRLDTQSRGPAEHLGCRRTEFRDAATNEVRRG